MAPRIKGNDSQFTLRMPNSLKEECETLAKEEGVSLNDWILIAIANRLASKAKDMASDVTKRCEELERRINAIVKKLGVNSEINQMYLNNRNGAVDLIRFAYETKYREYNCVGCGGSIWNKRGDDEASVMLSYLNVNGESTIKEFKVSSEKIDSILSEYGSIIANFEFVTDREIYGITSESHRDIIEQYDKVAKNPKCAIEILKDMPDLINDDSNLINPRCDVSTK